LGSSTTSEVALCETILSRHVEVARVGDKLVAVRPLRGTLAGALEAAYEEAASRGCYFATARTGNGVEIIVAGARRKRSRLLLGLALLAATIASVYISGLAVADPAMGPLWTPASFVLGLLGPLAVHEAGHWVAMRVYRVPSSIPYFIPAPPLQLGFIGTFGAIINMHWLPPRPSKLAIIGIAGPLAGFVAALPVALAGFAASIVAPAAAAGGTLQLIPLIMLLLPPPAEPGPGQVIILSTTAFASYIVFLVTFLNLIPVGMLDGGHVARSLLGYEGHKRLSTAVAGLLIAAALVSPHFAGFALIVLLMLALTGGANPGAAVEEWPPGRGAVASAVAYGALLALTLPVPV